MTFYIGFKIWSHRSRPSIQDQKLWKINKVTKVKNEKNTFSYYRFWPVLPYHLSSYHFYKVSPVTYNTSLVKSLKRVFDSLDILTAVG